jgi:PAS domain S-box-containing protein
LTLFDRFYEFCKKLVGNRKEFTLEFRIYHAILVITGSALIYNVGFKYYIGSIEGSWLALIFLFINIYLYYISRFNKQMGNNVVLFAIAGNCLVIANFFINSGVDGPSLLYSAIYVLLIMAISPAKQHRLFVLLNFAIIVALIYLQYVHPGMFVTSYPNVAAKYIDMASGYFFALALIYFTLRYIRKNYAFEKLSAEQKAQSIINQQQFIINQNKELSTLNERFEYVTKATFDAIWDWDIAKNELFWGRGYETIFGYISGSGEMNNNYILWQTRVHPDDAKRVLQTLQAAIAEPHQHFWQEQYRYLKADGTYAYVIDRGYMIRDADNKAIRIVGALQDITSLKEQELHIIQQNDRLRKIADINSHELRKPVATIMGIMQLIKEEDIEDELNIQLLEYLRITTNELDEVIRRVADNTHEYRQLL